MKVSENYPPNYAQYKEYFPSLKEFHPVFCYGDTIHNPFKVNLTPDILKHEEVHMKQQGNFIDIWHNKYFLDPEFRLQQEVEAYAVQYRFIKQFMKGKLLDWGLDQMAHSLSSELYGNLLTFGQAKSKIRKFMV